MLEMLLSALKNVYIQIENKWKLGNDFPFRGIKQSALIKEMILDGLNLGLCLRNLRPKFNL